MSYTICEWISEGISGLIKTRKIPTSLHLKSDNLELISRDEKTAKYLNRNFCLFELNADGSVIFFSYHEMVMKNVAFITAILQENGLL